MRAMSEKRADQTTCAAFWVKGIAETLEAAGLDIHALFEEAGLELTALSDADARFPTEGISRLWQLAVTRSGNPAIGLANSSAVKPGSFDVVAYAMRGKQDEKRASIGMRKCRRMRDGGRA